MATDIIPQEPWYTHCPWCRNPIKIRYQIATYEDSDVEQFVGVEKGNSPDWDKGDGPDWDGEGVYPPYYPTKQAPEAKQETVLDVTSVEPSRGLDIP